MDTSATKGIGIRESIACMISQIVAKQSEDFTPRKVLCLKLPEILEETVKNPHQCPQYCEMFVQLLKSNRQIDLVDQFLNQFKKAELPIWKEMITSRHPMIASLLCYSHKTGNTLLLESLFQYLTSNALK